jgi:hypothetical protein
MHHIILIMFCSILLLVGVLVSLAKNRFRVIDISQEEIVLRKFHKNINIMWRDIKAIFPEFHKPTTINFLLIETIKGEIYAVKTSYNSVDLDNIYKKMLEEIVQRKFNIHELKFQFSAEIEKKLNRRRTFLIFSTAILLILGIGRYFQIGIHLSDPTFFLIAPLICFGFIKIVKSNKDIYAKSLCVGDHGIKLFFKNNNIYKFYEYSDIEICKIDKFYGLIKFNDRFYMKELEKLYYWPLLREHLINKLQNAKSDRRC